MLHAILCCPCLISVTKSRTYSTFVFRGQIFFKSLRFLLQISYISLLLIHTLLIQTFIPRVSLNDFIFRRMITESRTTITEAIQIPYCCNWLGYELECQLQFSQITFSATRCIQNVRYRKPRFSDVIIIKLIAYLRYHQFILRFHC